jgi:uncharacterized phiE125 gp8 family phage protein
MPQPFALTLVTPPATDPVTLAQAKARCRVTTDDEDADLTALIAEATAAAEAECGRQFSPATYTLALDEFPRLDDGRADCIRLPRPPCSAVTWVKYFDAAGAEQTMSAVDYYTAVAGEPARIVPVNGWPATQANRPEAVTVRFVAGFATIPAAVRSAILEIVAHRWKNRGDEAKAGIPAVARRMLDSLEFGEVR